MLPAHTETQTEWQRQLAWEQSHDSTVERGAASLAMGMTESPELTQPRRAALGETEQLVGIPIELSEEHSEDPKAGTGENVHLSSGSTSAAGSGAHAYRPPHLHL